jgi:hypothetical protein
MKVIYKENILERILTEKKKADIFGIEIEKIILTKLEMDSIFEQNPEIAREIINTIYGIKIEIDEKLQIR